MAELSEWRPEARVEERGGGPCTTGEAASAPFGCTVFISTGGDAAGVPMGWLSSRPLLVRVQPPLNPGLDGGADLEIGVATPCNYFSVPVARDGDVLTATTGYSTTMMGCLGTEGLAEGWVSDFVGRSMAFELNGSTLVLRSGEDTITLTAAPTPD